MVPCFRACVRSLGRRSGIGRFFCSLSHWERVRTLFVLLHAESVNQRGDDRLGKAARKAHYRWILFVEEVARVVGKLKLAAKDEVLIVVKHAVLMLVTHSHGGRDRHFKN